MNLQVLLGEVFFQANQPHNKWDSQGKYVDSKGKVRFQGTAGLSESKTPGKLNDQHMAFVL